MSVRVWIFVAAAGVLLASCSTPSRENGAVELREESFDGSETMESDGDADDVSVSVSIEELDQSFNAYVACLEPELDGVIHVNFDRFVSMKSRYGLPDGRDGDELVESIVDGCEVSSQLDRRMSAFLATHSLSSDVLVQIADEVEQCTGVSGLDSPSTSGTAPQSIDEIVDAVSLYPPPSDPAIGRPLFTCFDEALYGPQVSF